MVDMIEVDDNFNFGAVLDLVCCLVAMRGIYKKNKNYLWPVIVCWFLMGLVNLISLVFCYNINKKFSIDEFEVGLGNDGLNSDSDGLPQSVYNRKIISYFEVDLPKGSIYVSSKGKVVSELATPIFIMLMKFLFFVLHVGFAILLMKHRERLWGFQEKKQKMAAKFENKFLSLPFISFAKERSYH